MTIFSKLFGKNKVKPQLPGRDEKLVPVPIPALGILLLNLEKQKANPLTMQEVIDARDKAICIMLPQSEKLAMDEKRGYRDVDLEDIWASWLAFRVEASDG